MKASAQPWRPTRDNAEALALQALAHVAADDRLLRRLLALTGLTPAALRDGAARPEVLGAVLDFVLNDERLLLEFAAAAGIPADRPLAARRLLPGSTDVA
jgi:hypothetical protein